MMASCFLCGKKIGFFDTESQILEKPICNSCHERIMDDVDSVLSVCKSEAEVEEKSKQITKKIALLAPLLFVSTEFCCFVTIIFIKVKNHFTSREYS